MTEEKIKEHSWYGKDFKVFKFIYKNAIVFMTNSTEVENSIKEEFSSVVFYGDTSFNFSSEEDEIVFLMKYNNKSTPISPKIVNRDYDF